MTEQHAYTLKAYLQVVPEQAALFTALSYESLLTGAAPSGPGVFIFSDIERLDSRLTPAALALWERLDTARRLNHPVRSMRRFELLRTRFEADLNDFNVYRLNGKETPQRWPVFVRNENEHDGALTPLLDGPRALAEVQRKLGQPEQQRLVVELCDTRDEHGLARKYSAFCVGTEIVPRHVFFSKTRWCIKQEDLVTPELVAEEQAYLEQNPHAGILSQIFADARIEYGRIDYSLKGGKIQVWEINTNPMLLRQSQMAGTRSAIHGRFRSQITQIFARLDAGVS